MIIVKVMGGLGNQMQQYALYRKLLSLGKSAKLDLSWFEDKKLQAGILAPRELELRRFAHLPMKVCTPEEKRRLTGSGSIASRIVRKLTGNRKVFEEYEMYHPEILKMDDTYLVGYFACNKYYADILPGLRKDFIFPVSSNEETARRNEEIRREMESGKEIPVSIHIRRGDYLDSANAGLLGGICTPEYYAGAVHLLEKRFPDDMLHFYVFSDDPAFARECGFGSKGEPVTVCDWNTGEDNMLDMELMSHCRCHITANSTFSFWGARLCSREDPVFIRPLRHRNNQIPEPEEMHALWEDWILIDTDGKTV